MGWMDALLAGGLDWERESYPAYGDFAALPFFVLFFPTVRFFLDRFVFEVRLVFVTCWTWKVAAKNWWFFFSFVYWGGMGRDLRSFQVLDDDGCELWYGLEFLGVIGRSDFDALIGVVVIICSKCSSKAISNSKI